MIFIIVRFIKKAEIRRTFIVMKRDKRSNVLRYIIGSYCLLYLAMLITEAFSPESSIEDALGGQATLVTVVLAFVIFFVGTIYAWFNELIAGIIICSWHFLVWVFSLLIWPEAGMVLLLIFPMLLPGVLLIRNWYIRDTSRYTDINERWRLTLKILLINYAAIYSLMVFVYCVTTFTGWTLPTRVDDLLIWDYSSQLGLILIFLFILFFIGTFISKRSELVTGIIFILWYILIWLVSISYPEFANSGPSTIFGLVILIQGIFYITLHIKERNTDHSV